MDGGTNPFFRLCFCKANPILLHTHYPIWSLVLEAELLNSSRSACTDILLEQEKRPVFRLVINRPVCMGVVALGYIVNYLAYLKSAFAIYTL